MTENARVAVLIDCDNMSHRWVRQILAETAKAIVLPAPTPS